MLQVGGGEYARSRASVKHFVMKPQINADLRRSAFICGLENVDVIKRLRIS